MYMTPKATKWTASTRREKGAVAGAEVAGAGAARPAPTSRRVIPNAPQKTAWAA
jgi:hypothetical protein